MVEDKSAPLPLEGVRIVDFTWALAGPIGPFLLALMGAEVIKVEPPRALGEEMGQNWRLNMFEPFRGHRGAPGVVPDVHCSKLSITCNLGKTRGIEVLKRLIGVSDVMMDNFRGGVLDRLGLGWDVVRRINPTIVKVHQSANGNFGPERDVAGYAPSFAALGGASYMTGYEDGPPVELRLPADLMMGTTTALSILIALWHVRRTGEGQFVDVANRETFGCFIGEFLLDGAINGRATPRVGNKDYIKAPHNVYKCRGDNRWVAIAVGTEEEWRALCHAVGHPEWLEDPRFGDKYLRWKNQHELDEMLRAWAAEYTPQEVMEILQAVGVAAGPSYSPEDALADPHLHERGAIVTTQNQEGNSWISVNAPWRFSRSPIAWRRWPELGEHNGQIYQELLGLSEEETAQLQHQGDI